MSLSSRGSMSIKYFIINYMEPLPKPKGKIWRAHQFAHSLGSKNYDVTYLTSSFDHFKKEYRQLQPLNCPYKMRFLFAHLTIATKVFWSFHISHFQYHCSFLLYLHLGVAVGLSHCLIQYQPSR